MKIKDMINHAHSKDATSFEKAFADVMSDKMDSALGAKFDDMFGGAPAEVELEAESSEVEADVEIDHSDEQPDSEVE